MNRDLEDAMREDAEQTGMADPEPGSFATLLAIIVLIILWVGLVFWAIEPPSLP